MPSAPAVVDRVILVAAVFLTCVAFLPPANDPVNVVKFTLLVTAALALLVAGAARVLQDRVVHLPVSAAAASAALLAVALCLSAATAPVASTAVYGTYGRNSGLLAYLSAGVLFFVGLRALAPPGTQALIGAVTASGGTTAVYGLVQRAGWDPYPWDNPFNPIIAALGNPNFASGYLGIAAAVAAGGALWSGWSAAWRTACAATALLCLVTALLTGSVQGPIAAAAGGTVLACAWLLEQPRRSRLAGLGAIAAAVTAAAGVVAMGVAGRGPAAVLADIGTRARGAYFEAAITMWQDRPLLGVGLDHYGKFWRTSRSSQSLEVLQGNDYADAAHSVPLQMLAQGGLVLGLAYAAFVTVTAVVLVRGLLLLRGPDRMLLACVGGGWAAYQVQSWVSIDQVPLIVLHFTLAAAVAAAAGAARTKQLRLPGALPPAPPTDTARASRRVSLSIRERRRLEGLDIAVLGVAGLVALAGLYLALAPVRADIAVRTGDDALAVGDGNASLAAYDRAVSLVPGQSLYWRKKANLFVRATPPDPAAAQSAYREALAADPYDVDAIKALARLTEMTGDVDDSRLLYRRAVALEPFDEGVVTGAAVFELRSGDPGAATAMLEAASRRLPGSAAVWDALGDASTVGGDRDAARAAYERALALDPEHEEARQALDRLDS